MIKKTLVSVSLGAVLAFPLRAEVQVLHSFQIGPHAPQSRLVQALDGNFYGVAISGGSSGAVNSAGSGCVFRATPAGIISVAASFFGTNGANPQAALVPGSDGVLYGATPYGGALNCGVIFSVTTGGALTTLYSFDTTHGQQPQAGLVFGNDGALYGTTYYGGANGFGTVFRLTTAGVLTNLYSFGPTNPFPATTLCLGPDGNFYGATMYGPDNGASSYLTAGTLFRISPSGAFTQLVGLSNSIGTQPGNTLTLGTDGAIYGTTTTGGSDGAGTAFRLATDGSFSLLANFVYTITGGKPSGGLTLGTDANFYGACSGAGTTGDGTIFKLVLNPGHLTNSVITQVTSFNGTIDGSAPASGLTLGNDGKLYGTTSSGAGGGGCFYSTGISAPITALAFFNDPGGVGPRAQLTLAPDGNFYGTTFYGGPGNDGSIFRITTNGVFTQLATFSDATGKNPVAPLCVGADGALYGSASGGGVGNVGSLFRLTTNGVFQTIFELVNAQTGGDPFGGMALGPDGALYGTTQYGGATNGTGQGTVFRLTASGTNYTVTNLVVFTGPNGANPQGTLLDGGDGFLYGTTFSGGTNNYGTVFRVNTNGAFNTVAYLMGTNGYQPIGGLARGRDGAFYGTVFGNAGNYRFIYRVTTNGVATSIFPLPGNYGTTQYGNLVAGPDGFLYDAIFDGGLNGAGLLFRLNTNGIPAIVSILTLATGAKPFSSPVFGPDGNLYGSAFYFGPGGGGTIYRYAFDRITSFSRNGNNALITSTATAGGAYSLFASTNLATGVWTNLATTTATNALVQFTDPNANHFPTRFYRTAAQ